MKWEEALVQKYGVPRDRLVSVFADSLNVRGIGSAKPADDRRHPAQGRDDAEERERAKERE